MDVKFCKVVKMIMWYYYGYKFKMNINESCLLNFLLNPDEINIMTGIFQKNIQEIESKIKTTKEIAPKTA